MIFMSYCRMQNTCTALAECISAVYEMIDNEKNTLDSDEENKRKNLKNLCQEFIDACDELEELEEE